MRHPPKHREIERKFVVLKLPKNLRSFPHAKIAQGYLAIAPKGVQVRLRKKATARSLTYKSGAGGAREEREIMLTPRQFAVLWPGTFKRRLTKIRYDVPWGKHTVEIDLYQGRHKGLVVAEVEFKSKKAAASFQRPDWLGKDVTRDPRYSNQLLATKG